MNSKPKRFQYSPSKVERALEAIEGGMKVLTASTVFKVPRTTLRNKLSEKSPRTSAGYSRYHSKLGEEVENMLVNWIIECAEMGFPVNKEDLCTSVQKLVNSSNMGKVFGEDNRPGRKWYEGFMKRHPSISQKHAEYVNRARGSVTPEKIKGWFDEVKNSLKDDITILENPQRIFNMDETYFALTPKGDLILGPKGRQIYEESSNSDKENVTTLFTVNAQGEMAPPLTLYKYTRMQASIVKAAPPGWGIGKTESGWMTGESFFEYISNVFIPYLNEKEICRPVIVFLDGHKSHLTFQLSKFCRDNQIHLVALYPNSTHILQPLDVALFSPFKKKLEKINSSMEA